MPTLKPRPSITLTCGRASIPIGDIPRTCTFEKVLPSDRATLINVMSSADLGLAGGVALGPRHGLDLLGLVARHDALHLRL